MWVFLFVLFIHLFLTVLSLHCYMGFSRVVVNGGYSHYRASTLGHTGSAAVGHGFSCHRHVGSSWARDQIYLLHWQMNSQPLDHQGSPLLIFKDVLAAQCPLHFHLHFKISLSISPKIKSNWYYNFPRHRTEYVD